MEDGVWWEEGANRVRSNVAGVMDVFIVMMGTMTS